MMNSAVSEVRLGVSSSELLGGEETTERSERCRPNARKPRAVVCTLPVRSLKDSGKRSSSSAGSCSSSSMAASEQLGEVSEVSEGKRAASPSNV